MRGVVNGDTLRHVEPLQLTRLLKHGLPAAPRIAATKAELRRDCNSQVRPPDRLFGKHPPSCKVATSPAPHPAMTHEGRTPRSEEHTSELQSLMRISYAVFCLKKKQ